MNSQELLAWCRSYSSVEDDSSLNLRSPLVMGVLNVTPNSFSDGGRYLTAQTAKQRALELIKHGVDVIDVGGEASNPGVAPISAEEELSRVIPVISAIRSLSDIAISIDTCKAIVMSEAVKAGASMINDIRALQDTGALQIAKELNVPICLMHMKGVPQTMQDEVDGSRDVLSDIQRFFNERMAACLDAGISRDHVILDPGIGFGKSTRQNLTILKQLATFNSFGRPLLLGVSRKRLIGEVLQKPVEERLIGGLTIAIYAMLNHVHIIRTHDVDETRQAVQMIKAIHFM